MNRSVLTALLLALGVGGWVLSGQIDLLDGDVGATVATAIGEPQAAEEAPPLKVRGRIIEAGLRTREIVVRGRTEAVRTVDVRAETYGRVIEVVAAEGARVQRGDVIVRFALDDREARLAEGAALVRQRQIEHDAAERLAAKGYRSRTNTAAAKAALDAAKAAVARIRTEIEHTVIRAPFEGVVEVRQAEIGDYLKVGEVIATVVDEDPILVVASVSERDVGRLRLGQQAGARLVTGERVSGKIRYIGTTADPATRTFRFEVEVANRGHRIRAGVTSEIRIPVEEVSAHLVSPAILSLDDDGVIGLRIVNADGVVEFHPARIVAEEGEGMWLGGLPEIVTVITVGQEFVRDGDRVEVVLEEAGPGS